MINVEFDKVAKYAYKVVVRDADGNYCELGILQKISKHWYLMNALAKGVAIQRFGDTFDEAHEWIKLRAHLQISHENLTYVDPLCLFDEAHMKVYTPEMIKMMKEGKHIEND